MTLRWREKNEAIQKTAQLTKLLLLQSWKLGQAKAHEDNAVGIAKLLQEAAEQDAYMGTPTLAALGYAGVLLGKKT